MDRWSSLLVRGVAPPLFTSTINKDQDTCLTTPTQRQDQMQYGSRGDVELPRCLVVSHLPSTKNQPLLRRRHSRLLFHLLLYARDLVIGVDIELDLLPCKRLDFDQHGEWRAD